MKQSKLNVLAMHERVLTYFNDHAAIWQSVQPIAVQVAALNTSVVNRWTALVGQQIRTSGATLAKSKAQKAAVETVLRLALFANSYALAYHDTNLYAQTARSRRYLLNLPDDQMLAALTQMLNVMEPVQAVLVPYGVTPGDFTAARDEVAYAQSLRNAARSAIDARKTAGSGIKAEEQAGRQALQIIDRAIHFFDRTQPGFVTGYHHARKIIHEGVRHRNDTATAED